jgi:hypothetical protein
MSEAPEKGETVTVCPSRMGRLSLYPPSMTRTPRYRGGSHPEKIGMKVEAITTCKSTSSANFFYKIQTGYEGAVIEPCSEVPTGILRTYVPTVPYNNFCR